MSLFGTLGNFASGGAQSDESSNQAAALAALEGVAAPTAQELDLPTLQKYASALNMTPAQMQAFLQQQNALANENVDQTGTQAEQAALAQLANTANQGAAGNATEQAQESQIMNQSNENLAGQRGAIEQAAQARGVPVSLLQAALEQQNAGQDAQSANQAALNAQSNNYQTALNALANQGTLGGQLQGGENAQANTVAQAQNAMQQFNAANQQAAAATNAGYQQQANEANTAAANHTNEANTGLANEQTSYNAAVPQTVFNDQLAKATGVAQQQQNASQNKAAQGAQNFQIAGGLTGLGATTIEGGNNFGSSGGGSSGGGGSSSTSGGTPLASGGGDSNLASMADTAFANGGIAGYSGGNDGYANGNIVGGLLSLLMADGGVVPCMKQGGMIPGKAKVPGDSKVNDTVPIRVSPGEAVVPRSVVQQNPADVMRLLAGRPSSTPRPGEPGPGMPMTHPGVQQPQPGHDPKDIAALLMAMKHLRGAH